MTSDNLATRAWHAFVLGVRREPGAMFAYVALAVIIVAWVFRTPGLTITTFTISIGGKLPLVLVAVGMAIVLISRGIDLSVGSLVALSNVIVVHDALWNGHTWIGAIAAVAVTALVGFGNGLLVGALRLPALVVTVATGAIAGGLALYIQPQPGGKVTTGFTNFIMLVIGPVPLALLLIFLIPLAIWYPISRSRAGFALRAVGGDEASAFVSGLSTWRSRALAYTLSGTFAGLAGVFLTMTTSSGDPNGSRTFTLQAIAAAVLGGVALAGGRGSIAGAVGGGLMLGFITNLLSSWRVNSNWQYIVTGALLIAVIGVPYVISQIRARKSPHE
ncbi:MAG: ABC transporter permease [Propionibacteriaceae bacterium]|nr:ABC transporter permease [Propionibacteriaceae bacterium]